MSVKRQTEDESSQSLEVINKKQKDNNDEDQPSSHSDISSSEEEEDLNGRDGDGEGETDPEALNRQKKELLTYGKSHYLTNEERSHELEDEDGCIIKFKTISIFFYNLAKKSQIELIEIIKVQLCEAKKSLAKTPDLESHTELIERLESELCEANKGLAELEEKVKDVKCIIGDFMFISESSDFSLNPKQKELFERVIRISSCAFLPSPEVFKSEGDDGLDRTGTLQDFQTVFNWVENHILCEQEKYSEISGMVDEETYNDLIKFAFKTEYELMRDSPHPEGKMLMFYYYAGHGFDPNNAGKSISAAPVLDHILPENYFKDASPYISKSRKAKGGEMFLHKFGYCDFEGLVEPFIAAIKSEPTYSSGKKKNKHLLIVLDSCYSGQFAEDLKTFSDKRGQGWLNEGCSVTVQASCRKDEKAVGGYFTPTFTFLNDSENKSLLKILLGNWDKMKKEEKDKWNQLPFPSPVVSSTVNLPDSPIHEVWFLVENKDCRVALFQDAGFFKYCHCKIFGPLELEEIPKLGTSRVLAIPTATTFLKDKKFEVIDFKLKTYKGERFGLFLLKDPLASNRAVCAHVHFTEGGTSKVGRINLVHHRYERNCIPQLDYPEDEFGLSRRQIDNKEHHIPVAMVPNCKNADEFNHNHWVAWKWETLDEDQSFLDLAKAELSSGFNVDDNKQQEVACAMELVAKCHQFVVDKDPSQWSDPTQWNKTFNQFSHLKLFREKQRSLFMENYCKQIKGFHLPKVQ